MNLELRAIVPLKQLGHQMHGGMIMKVRGKIADPNAIRTRPVRERAKRRIGFIVGTRIRLGNSSMKPRIVREAQQIEWRDHLIGIRPQLKRGQPTFHASSQLIPVAYECPLTEQTTAGRNVILVKIDRLPETDGRLLVSAEIVEGHTQVIVRLRLARIKRHRLFITGNRLFEPA